MSPQKMLSNSIKNFRNSIHHNKLSFNTKANVLISRNFAKKQLLSYSDDQIALQIKMIKSSDIVSEQFIGTEIEKKERENLLKVAIELRNSIKNKDVDKVQSIYIESHLDEKRYWTKNAFIF